ncbi:Golgi-associated plant pathogenesis-related protein 1-like [Cyprinodon tularosa]|uniref:Golgi-associated plant pathogenesis-related protein 1-like n=1 Tax=Cyprinodon tularosa TaxID=77115 RepID=UPI0018E1E901|nr:Golgi-associated plant pathogenesis-related protein 1-like [Cyprinodon tularosa]XP_038126965.1 Golgi-associated plant pathogenesis-related protein 1-like [Cyprinodon tularosa]XP_038126966.1 Golgi-associated plant pathogenesis-related protein 1-like [Cyprinodon tularosa]
MADKAYRKEFLEAHNKYREMHNAPPLKYNDEMNKKAQEWANYLLQKRKPEHSRTDDGENIFYFYSDPPRKQTGKEAVENWYREIQDYNFKKPGFDSKTGHFTQLVWKDSKELGVGFAARGPEVYVVAQYRPAGNVRDYFETCVLPKK